MLRGPRREERQGAVLPVEARGRERAHGQEVGLRRRWLMIDRALDPALCTGTRRLLSSVY